MEKIAEEDVYSSFYNALFAQGLNQPLCNYIFT